MMLLISVKGIIILHVTKLKTLAASQFISYPISSICYQTLCILPDLVILCL